MSAERIKLKKERFTERQLVAPESGSNVLDRASIAEDKSQTLLNLMTVRHAESNNHHHIGSRK